MFNGNELKAGDRIGTVSYSGRSNRRTYTQELVVVKVTKKQVVAHLGGLPDSVVRFDHSGFPVDSYRRGHAYRVDDPKYLEAKTTADAERAAERAAADAELVARMERFGHSPASCGTEIAFRAVDRIAQQALGIEDEIRRRIDRVRPESLYREIEWLKQSMRRSVELDWYLSLLVAIRDRPAEVSVLDVIREMRDSARSQFQNGSDCGDESIARAFGAREVARSLESTVARLEEQQLG